MITADAKLNALALGDLNLRISPGVHIEQATSSWNDDIVLSVTIHQDSDTRVVGQQGKCVSSRGL